jgi:hypothetical protein
MNLRRQIFIIAVALAPLAMPSSARSDVKVCPIEETIKHLEDYNTTLRANLARQKFPLLTELQTITAKAKNPSLPTGAQLSKADQDRFQQLREQMLALDAQDIVNSGYLRDSRVIAQAAKVAYDQELGRSFDENSPDFFYYSILGLLELEHPQGQLEITTPRDGECSIEAALYFNEQLIFQEMSSLNTKKAADTLQDIAHRYALDYKQQGWIEKIPALLDQQTARMQMGTIEQGRKIIEYMNNIENLKALARVSVLGYQSDLEDIRVAHNEEELNRIGTGWTERAKKYDEHTQFLAGLLILIAQKMPSETAIEVQGRVKRLQEQGIIK